MDFLEKLETAEKEGLIPENLSATLRHFYLSYQNAIEESGGSVETYHPILNQYLGFVVEQLQTPFTFPPYHSCIRAPFDYYQFGLDFIRPLLIREESSLVHPEQLARIRSQLNLKENVILFANHQTEPDPQAISLMLEENDPALAKDMIFVAGHRVTTDPLAVPLSKGRNLLCIYSKKHIEHPPEKKEEKLRHNRATMRKMSELLSEGGKCIYVAPSGGRDRPNEKGEVEVAPFDPQSIEMFHLMAKQSGHPTHFYPLALATYQLLPPPSSVLKELGEVRQAHCTPIHLAFGEEISMDQFPGSGEEDKKVRREFRARHIWEQVCDLYHQISQS